MACGVPGDVLVDAALLGNNLDTVSAMGIAGDG